MAAMVANICLRLSDSLSQWWLRDSKSVYDPGPGSARGSWLVSPAPSARQRRMTRSASRRVGGSGLWHLASSGPAVRKGVVSEREEQVEHPHIAL